MPLLVSTLNRSPTRASTITRIATVNGCHSSPWATHTAETVAPASSRISAAQKRRLVSFGASIV